MPFTSCHFVPFHHQLWGDRGDTHVTGLDSLGEEPYNRHTAFNGLRDQPPPRTRAHPCGHQRRKCLHPSAVYLITFYFSTLSHWHSSVSWHHLRLTYTINIDRPSASNLIVGCPLLDYSGKKAYKGAYIYFVAATVEVTAAPPFCAATDFNKVYIVLATNIESVDGYCPTF